MNSEKISPVRISGGAWGFTQTEEGWVWSVAFRDGKIVSSQPFEKWVDAVEDARQHGYGKTLIFK